MKLIYFTICSTDGERSRQHIFKANKIGKAVSVCGNVMPVCEEMNLGVLLEVIEKEQDSELKDGCCKSCLRIYQKLINNQKSIK